jgi:hypothetical protein
MSLDYYELIAYDSGMGSLLNGVAARRVVFIINPQGPVSPGFGNH